MFTAKDLRRGTYFECLRGQVRDPPGHRSPVRFSTWTPKQWADYMSEVRDNDADRVLNILGQLKRAKSPDRLFEGLSVELKRRMKKGPLSDIPKRAVNVVLDDPELGTTSEGEDAHFKEGVGPREDDAMDFYASESQPHKGKKKVSAEQNAIKRSKWKRGRWMQGQGGRQEFETTTTDDGSSPESSQAQQNPKQDRTTAPEQEDQSPPRRQQTG
ncbi:unnamed protein product [Tilletia controversa]|nr:unnamed protein product [Tilletia controversa]